MSDERALARQAASNFGLLHRGQWSAAGVGRGAADHRRVTGRWELRQRNVVAIGGAPPDWRQDVLAACLAAGSPAHASHRAAAVLHGLWWGEVPVELTVPYATSPAVRGAVVHRSQRLGDADWAPVGGIPASTVSRMLADLGSVWPDEAVQPVLRRALGRSLTTVGELEAVLARAGGRGRRGVGTLRRLLAARARFAGTTESELEERFVEICGRYQLPTPVLQHEVILGGRRRRIDVAFPEHQVAVEIDGYEVHTQRPVFEDDRRRQNDLVLAGWVVLRFTAEVLFRAPWLVASAVVRALARAAPPTPGQGARPRPRRRSSIGRP